MEKVPLEDRKRTRTEMVLLATVILEIILQEINHIKNLMIKIIIAIHTIKMKKRQM